MSIVQDYVNDSLALWQSCLDSDFITQLEKDELSTEQFLGYIIDDSLYLKEYARVFAWGMIHAESYELIRQFHHWVSYLQEGETATRVCYLQRFALDDRQLEKFSQRPENKAYTDYMLAVAKEGTAEVFSVILPCALSYEWIFKELIKRSPQLLHSRYAEVIGDYVSESCSKACREMCVCAEALLAQLSASRLAHCREIFRSCSEYELAFWKMSACPRDDTAYLFER